MLPIVVVFLSIIAVVVLATIIFMIENVLREGPRRKPEEASRWRWRPPLGSRTELVAWATKLGETVAHKLVSQSRNPAMPTQLAEEVTGGATFAVNNLPYLLPEADVRLCQNRDFCRMGVTAPEVLAIADQLRADPDEARRIHDIAVRNAEAFTGVPSPQTATSPLVCPLVASDGSCVAHKLRPVSCRTNFPFEGGGAVTDERSKYLREVAKDLGEGVEAGLSRGLTAAGLDGQIYELNSALATALELPNASAQWTKGENIFANCATYRSLS